MSPDIILQHKCVLIINDTNKRPRVSISTLWIYQYINGLKTSGSLSPIVLICANCFRYLYTSLLHKYHLPPIIHNLPIINLHMFIQHCIKNKTYRNSQSSSVKHTFTAPFGANPINTGLNGSRSSGLRVKKLQDVPTC